ncbi:Ferroporti-1 [Mycena floridula]|nr:Ferroporti-1 [Mycena floridula]
MSDESTPLLGRNAQSHGRRYLLIQHLSNAWVDRTAEFALHLYIISFYKNTLLPSSILGFSTTLTGIFLSRWAGALVDNQPKLKLVRICIFVQKLSALSAYLLLYWLPSTQYPTALFALIVLFGCALNLSNICVSLAIEKDWATSISRGIHDDGTALGQLNASLRQINLLCKLVAPLFVSFIMVKFDSPNGATVSNKALAANALLSLGFEQYWIGIVYRSFPQLAIQRQQPTVVQTSVDISPTTFWTQRVKCAVNYNEWKELAGLPVFLSSISISLLYLTVLSFDGIMLGYLKTVRYSDDVFLAEMRALCVVTGLLGTMFALPLERKLGSVRAGNWSIWSMVICLFPVVLSFFLLPQNSPNGSVTRLWAATLLFGGMALSRIGLWSFDLIQTKQLQNALDAHPKRNSLTGLQYTMQSIADLLKYILTMVLSRPSQFRYATLVSFCSVTTGAIVYTGYVKKERGHIIHVLRIDWIKKYL